MDENYIPGFTNELYSSSGMTPYGDYYYDPSMYSDAMVSPYGRMGGDYYEPIDYYDPSIYSEPNYGIDPYGRMAGEQVGMPQAVEPMGGLDIMGGGGSDMTLARPGALYGTSTASPYSKPSLTPSLDFVTNNGQQGYYFVTNAGKRAKTKANPTAFVAVDPNAQYRLVNERGKNTIVASGTGEQGLRDAYAMAQQLSTQGGKKADWYLERSDPNGNWTRIADDDPKGSDLGAFGKIASFALPIATAVLTGGMSLPAQMALSGLAGGVGGALAGKDPLKSALISAGTAGIVGGTGLDKAIGGALSGVGGQTAGQVAGQTVGQVAGQTAGEAAGEILVSGLSRGLLGAGSALAQGGIQGALQAATSGGGGSLTPTESGYGVYDPVEDVIINTATLRPTTSGLNLGGLGGAFSSPLSSIGTSSTITQPTQPTQPTEQPTDDIVVTADRPTTLPSPLGSAFANALPYGDNLLAEALSINQKTPQPVEEPTDEIVVTANRPTAITSPLGSAFANALPYGDNLLAEALSANQKTPQPEADKGTSLDDIIDYLRLAGLASSVLGGALGGGGAGDDTFTLPAGSGGLSSVFTSKLPPANIPGGVGTGGTAARPAADLAGQGLRDPKDYYRYGYGPEQSFFNYVPQGAPNTSQAYTGYAEGGYAVGGPGDGRDDKIPALLSDGEYVVDAETVALLGNGSNKAGAEMLDKFRVNLRKQKGRKLARGEFSADAKRPENYMAGRLT